MSVSMTSSIKFNHDLIDAYEKCTVLYDCDHPDYKAPAPTNESWAFVAAQCGTTPQDCRARWKALRDRYIKERKRRTLGKCDPAKKYWPLYSRMDFLDEYVEKQRRKYPKNGLTKDNQIRLSGSDLPAGLKSLDGSAATDASSLYSMLTATPDFLNGSLLDLDEYGAAMTGGIERETDLFSGIPYEKLIMAMEETRWYANGSTIFNNSISFATENNENAAIEPNRGVDRRLPNGNGSPSGSSFVEAAAAAVVAISTTASAPPVALSPLSVNASPSNGGDTTSAVDYLRAFGKKAAAALPRKPVDKSMSSPASAKTSSLSPTQPAGRKRPAPISAGDTLEALRQGAESLTRCTQALLERDAEATFGDYVASVLRVMSQEKRSEITAKIFTMLQCYQQ